MEIGRVFLVHRDVIFNTGIFNELGPTTTLDEALEVNGASSSPSSTFASTTGSLNTSATISTSASSNTGTPGGRSATTNKVAIGVAVGGVSLFVLIVAFIIIWYQRRKGGPSIIEQWRDPEWNENGHHVIAIQAGHVGEVHHLPSSVAHSNDASPTAPVHQETSVRLPDIPPTVQLSPNWPYRSGEKSRRRAREKDLNAAGLGPDVRLTRLLDDTPFEDMENGEEIVSPALADAGSTNIATPISRIDALRRVPSTRSLASLWSWSHRATRSIAEDEGDTLPAYTFRRSGSTTRSRTRSLRSSLARDRAPGAEGMNPPDYPFELARKIAQFYSRSPRRVLESRPPPDYGNHAL